jgi:hypothetical protein
MIKKSESVQASDSHLKKIALIMAVNCVRNTVIEEFHARGSLSQEDMRKLNKEVSNKIYTFLKFLLEGTKEEQSALIKTTGLFYPNNWDQPVIDGNISRAIKQILGNTEVN